MDHDAFEASRRDGNHSIVRLGVAKRTPGKIKSKRTKKRLNREQHDASDPLDQNPSQSPPPQPPHERRDQGGGGGEQQDQIVVATEQQPKKLAASSEQKSPPPPVLNAQPTAAVSNMKRNHKQVVYAVIPCSGGSRGPEPVKYLIENKETTSFAIHDFATLPQQKGDKVATNVFQVGGHPFKLWIFPRGLMGNTDTEYVSMYLLYAGENTETNPVNVRFQIWTKTSNGAHYNHAFATGPNHLWGTRSFKKRQDMILDDLDWKGTLTVEVDITIGKLGRPMGGAGTPTVALSSQRNEGGGSASVVVPNTVLPSGNNAVGVGNKHARKQNKNQSKKLATSSEQKPPPGQAEGATLPHFYAKVGNLQKLREYVPVPVLARVAGTTTNSFDVQDTNGWTPLLEAVRCGSLPIVKYLVEEHKVNITTLTKSGQSPLQLSQHYDRGNPQLHPVTVYLQEQLRDLSPSGNNVVGVDNKKAGNSTTGPTFTISSSSTTTASTLTIGAKRSTKPSATWAELPSSPTKEQVLATLAPCQLNAINFVKDKAKKFHEEALLKLKNRLPHIGGGSYTEEDLTQCLEYIREAPIIIHLKEMTLRVLVNDTHYRNQFETKTSGGKKDYAVRQQWEREMFSSYYDDVAGEMRVKYGCLNYCGDILGVKSVRQRYGPAYILLKSHVGNRATFSLKSKSTRSETIATNEYYAHVLHGYDDVELMKVLDVCKSARLGGRPSKCTEYKEVQIHGPICLATDIQALSIPGRQKDAGVFLSTVEAFRKKTNCNVLWQEDLLNPDDTKSKTVTSKKSKKRKGRDQGEGGGGGGCQDQSTNLHRIRVPKTQNPNPNRTNRMH